MSKIILFNKPYGVLSQFTGETLEETLAPYIPLKGFYPAGRLDKNSEGLLLLTDDGSVQHKLSHPRFNKQKYYWAQVEGIPSIADLAPLKRGITVSGVHYLPAQVSIIDAPNVWERTPPIRERKSIPTSWIELILVEGKNHQVRKMTAAIGYPTLRLIRHRIGDWKLGILAPGEYQLIDHVISTM